MTLTDEMRAEPPGNPAAFTPMPWPQAATLDEQRGYPRVALEIPVAFRNGSGQHCAARLRNLSPEGLQVACNIVTAQMIYPAGGKLQPDNQPILQATAVLPLADGPETLSLGVRLLYCSTTAESPNCIMGFQFLDLRPKARRIIDAFFAEQFRQFYFDEEPTGGTRAA